MAKNSIRDYDATNANNTDIQSIDISEGCSPAGINNAIREVMADLKDVSTGAVALESPSADSLTVTGDLTVDTSTLKVDSTNNRVGIANASPSVELDVTGAAKVSGDLTVDTNTLYVDSTNNRVGIGSSSPDAKLDIEGSTTASTIRLTDSGTSGHYHSIGHDGANGLSISADAGNVLAGTNITFDFDGVEAARIDSSGNVGIGTSSPTSPLHVSSGTTGNISNIASSNASYANDVFQIRCARSGATTQYNNLTVFDNNTTLKMLIRANGDLLNANNSYGSLSDETLKENIIDSASQWDDIKAIQVRKYNFIDSDETQIGVIAQELEAAGMSGLVDIVEMYSANEEDEPERNGEFKKSVKYSVLYMKALKALQEAMLRIETLEENQVALEARITALENA